MSNVRAKPEEVESNIGPAKIYTTRIYMGIECIADSLAPLYSVFILRRRPLLYPVSVQNVCNAKEWSECRRILLSKANKPLFFWKA